jgi:hypothetical protein
MYPLRYTAKARAPRSLIVVSIQLVQRYARARRRTGAAAQKPFQRRGEVFPARQGGEARGRGGGPETAGPGWRPHPSGRRLGESGCGTKRLALGRRVCVTSFGFSAAATPLSALSKEPAPNAVVLQPCPHVLQAQGLYTRPRSCSCTRSQQGARQQGSSYRAYGKSHEGKSPRSLCFAMSTKVASPLAPRRFFFAAGQY